MALQIVYRGKAKRLLMQPLTNNFIVYDLKNKIHIGYLVKDFGFQKRGAFILEKFLIPNQQYKSI